MSYFRNSDITKDYSVGSATVNKWLKDAITKKNNLQLTESKGKYRVLANEHNKAELARLYEEGRKYRSSVVLKKMEPSKEFYHNFNDEEVAEIYNDLTFSHEVQFKFSYKDGGAKAWDEYYKSGVSQHVPINNNFIISSLQDLTLDLDKGTKINIFDLGPGNGYPVRPLLEYIYKNFSLNSYNAIDISLNINQIATSNIENWFPDITVRSFETDIDESNFTKLFYLNAKADEINIILYLGHTICNHKDYFRVLQNLRKGMEKQDRLCFSFTNTEPKNRATFGYVKNENADFRHTLILSMLGIDVSDCENVIEYNPESDARFKYLVLDKDYEIKLKIYDQIKTIELKKGERISIWQHYLIDDIGLIENLRRANVGLDILKHDSTRCHSWVICKAI